MNLGGTLVAFNGVQLPGYSPDLHPIKKTWRFTLRQATSIQYLEIFEGLLAPVERFASLTLNYRFYSLSGKLGRKGKGGLRLDHGRNFYQIAELPE